MTTLEHTSQTRDKISDPINNLQERLGHSSITITMDTYGHLMPSMQKEAVLNFADLLKHARDEWSLESVG